MKFNFSTAKTNLPLRETLVIKVVDSEGVEGYGECVSFVTPFYTEETLEISKRCLKEELLPGILENKIEHPFIIHSLFSKRCPMALAGLEGALLDLFGKKNNQNIISMLFPEERRTFVDMGIVLGSMPYDELEKEINENIKKGCKRFKLKISPHDDPYKIKTIVKKFSDAIFLVDANKSFLLSQKEMLKAYDKEGLCCIEEPFHFEEMEECQGIQEYFDTPICLDESILTIEDLERAHRIQMFQMLNVKVGRFGGLYYVEKAITFCRKNNIKYWIGSMVESDISKMLHIQLASLKDTIIPGDLSDSKRYFEEDMIEPAIKFIKGRIKILDTSGLGINVKQERLEKYAVDLWRENG